MYNVTLCIACVFLCVVSELVAKISSLTTQLNQQQMQNAALMKKHAVSNII